MVISWEQYFMGLARLSALRSKDPNTQVGACIVDGNTNRILSVGYNGFPFGCSDKEFPWEKGNPDEYDNKYSYVVHAEANAILNSGKDLSGAILYTTLSPCKECVKLIIQSGIKEIVYLKKYEHDSRIVDRMLNAAGVSMREYKRNAEKVILDIYAKKKYEYNFKKSFVYDHEEVNVGE